MAVHFSDIPAELIAKVGDKLSRRDCLALSATSKSHRLALKPVERDLYARAHARAEAACDAVHHSLSSLSAAREAGRLPTGLFPPPGAGNAGFLPNLRDVVSSFSDDLSPAEQEGLYEDTMRLKLQPSRDPNVQGAVLAEQRANARRRWLPPAQRAARQAQIDAEEAADDARREQEMALRVANFNQDGMPSPRTP